MKRILFVFACAASLSVGAAESATPKSAPKFPSDIRVEHAVDYLPEGRTEKADLYFPLHMPKDAKLPAVVLIHGGGWNDGTRAGKRELNVGSTLARNGYVAMSVDYVLSHGKYAVWPTNLWDCKTAVRWLRKNADRLGVDPERIGVLGGSAGGHLAAMVALTTSSDGLDPAEPYGDISCRVSCCVDLYGIADIGTYHDAKMLGHTFAEAPELYRKASPITYVRSNSPPFLILCGTADTTVNPEQSKLLSQTLKQAGVEEQLLVIPGAPHSFDLQPVQRDLRPLVLGFFDKHLKPGWPTSGATVSAKRP
ncbi:MAG: alpha/beta hydrolase fold domain-containing protein [Verrucomicrobiota bacterium]